MACVPPPASISVQRLSVAHRRKAIPINRKHFDCSSCNSFPLSTGCGHTCSGIRIARLRAELLGAGMSVPRTLLSSFVVLVLAVAGLSPVSGHTADCATGLLSTGPSLFAFRADAALRGTAWTARHVATSARGNARLIWDAANFAAPSDDALNRYRDYCQ
jgi:hypothetical protein